MSPVDNKNALIDALTERDVIAADRERPQDTSSERPWYISAVLGLSGWLAGVFAMVFVALLFRPDSLLDYSLAAVVLLGAAFGLYAVDRDSAFFDQLALALSVAGQLAFVAAALELTDSDAGTAALTAVLQVGLLFAMPNRLARMLAAFFACLAWALALRLAWWDDLIHGSGAVALAPALIGWFVIWVPIAVLAHYLLKTEPVWMAHRLRRVVRPALSGLLLSLAIGTWASEPFGSLGFGVTQGEWQTNWLALWPLLGAAAALFAAWCAFRIRSRGLLGVAILGAFLHVAQFYYVLGARLLTKSAIMLAVGVALLLAAAQVRRFAESGARE